eukprot:COSAG05_NODE_24325_length_252_cov_0.679739_1_plen_73_part_10
MPRLSVILSLTLRHGPTGAHSNMSRAHKSGQFTKLPSFRDTREIHKLLPAALQTAQTSSGSGVAVGPKGKGKP